MCKPTCAQLSLQGSREGAGASRYTHGFSFSTNLPVNRQSLRPSSSLIVYVPLGSHCSENWAAAGSRKEECARRFGFWQPSTHTNASELRTQPMLCFRLTCDVEDCEQQRHLQQERRLHGCMQWCAFGVTARTRGRSDRLAAALA